MKTHNTKKRVVVTGVGVVAPNGIGKDEFWRNTICGKSGVMEIDFAKEFGFKSMIAGAVSHFNIHHYGLNGDYSLKDRYIQFALAAAKMALDDAKLNPFELDNRRVGVSIANAICGTKNMEQEFLRASKYGKLPINSKFVTRMLFTSSTFNIASTTLANYYDFHGPCCTIPTGCAAGLDAIGYCFDLIRAGKVDVMMTGASEAPIAPMVMASFDAIGALSSKYNSVPTQASRPYDKTRDGFVLAEGCGIIILEEREHAIKRGAPIFAEMKGYGSTCNSHHMTGLPKDGVDLARALHIALQDANITYDKVDYINSHGSSTPQNDINETSAYKIILKDNVYKVPISSLKSMCGHALAAANALEFIITVLSICHQCIHPTINYSTQDPECDLDYVTNGSIQREIKIALKNASGFSGIHSALVLSHPDY